jgi:nucleoside-diphosphate-sugar epimerase/aryl-alcohol dehydrogenase-like predicted oxidoreductase
MRLLILGGNKFLGKELVRLAQSQNHKLTIISLDPPESLNDVDWINVNRNNYDDLKFALEGREFDCVIDNIAFSQGQVAQFLSIIKDKTKRYVLTSTVDTYYAKNELRPADEDLDQNLYTNGFGNTKWERYVLGKRTLEKELRGDTSNIEKVIVRPCNVVGSDDNVIRHGFERSLYYPAKVLDDQPVILYHTDTEVFHLVYVKDVAAALLLVATHPDAPNQTFNIAGDTVWTSESLLQKIIDVSGSKSKIVKLNQKILIDRGMLSDSSEQLISPYGFFSSIHKIGLFDNSRLKSLGWSPSSDEEMIKSLFSNQEKISLIQQDIALSRSREISIALNYLDDYENFIEGRCTTSLSPVAIGTHRGENDDITDDEYRLSITESLINGINVVDTAINYRSGRSEKVISEVLESLISNNKIQRKDVYVITKGGYFVKPCKFPLLSKDELDKSNSMRSCFINWSLNESYKSLKLKTIDLFLLHNPEMALNYLDHKSFYRQLIEVFTMLEHEVSKGRIASYGIATWLGLISKPNSKTFLDLNEVLRCAQVAAGNKPHSLTSIELPLNVTRHYSFTRKNQTLNGNLVTVLELARSKNLKVFTSNSVLYGESTDDIESKLDFDSILSTPQKSLLFAKSMSGITSAIVGMRRLESVAAAVEVLKEKNIDNNTIDNIIKLCRFKTKE